MYSKVPNIILMLPSNYIAMLSIVTSKYHKGLNRVNIDD